LSAFIRKFSNLWQLLIYWNLSFQIRLKFKDKSRNIDILNQVIFQGAPSANIFLL